MKNLKKALAVIITAVMVLAFSGCGSSFDITGKWKSVGSSGFGQAQPGSIIIFNGTNCNFFSPSDTYAFYSDGGKYYLDISGLLGGNITSRVEVIDNNHIKIYTGDTVTELERKS